MSNILTMVQQIIINKYIAAKKAAAALASPAPVEAPSQKIAKSRTNSSSQQPVIAPKKKKRK
jgi:membrane protein insertase Oxa1/YidC/SpoIIIJ